MNEWNITISAKQQRKGTPIPPTPPKQGKKKETTNLMLVVETRSKVAAEKLSIKEKKHK